MRPNWALTLLKGVAVCAIVVWSILPIALILLASVRPPSEVLAVPPKLIFWPTAVNYGRLFSEWPDFLFMLRNSLIISVGATALTVLVSSLAAWVYSRHKGGILTATAFFMILVRMIPPIVVTLPLFPAINYLHLNDTHLVMILLYSALYVSVCTWIIKVFIDQIPRELEEAAQVDGASLWQIFMRVIFPLLAPGAVAASVFIFLFAWNEFLFAFMFTTSNAKTAPIAVSEMMAAVTGVDWGVVFAATCMQLLPALVFVVLMQRYLVAGLSAGAVKG